MKQDNALQVYYDEKLVGTLAMTANRKAAFQYTDEWLEHGFSISPSFFTSTEKTGIFTNKRLFFRSFWSVCRQSSG